MEANRSHLSPSFSLGNSQEPHGAIPGQNGDCGIVIIIL